MAGRPIKTARAPKASASNTSVPSLIPPSTYTSTFPLTASTISGRTSIEQKNILLRFISKQQLTIKKETLYLRSTPEKPWPTMIMTICNY